MAEKIRRETKILETLKYKKTLKNLKNPNLSHSKILLKDIPVLNIQKMDLKFHATIYY